MGQSSGVGVLDKAVLVLESAARSPVGLGDLVTATGLPRATAHRLAVALESHRMLVRDSSGRWAPGPRLVELAQTAPDPLLAAAGPVLGRLRDRSGDMFKRWTAGVMPTTILVDRQGRARWRSAGEIGAADTALQRGIDALVAE